MLVNMGIMMKRALSLLLISTFVRGTCEAGALVRRGRSYVLLDLPYVRVAVACRS